MAEKAKYLPVGDAVSVLQSRAQTTGGCGAAGAASAMKNIEEDGEATVGSACVLALPVLYRHNRNE